MFSQTNPPWSTHYIAASDAIADGIQRSVATLSRFVNPVAGVEDNLSLPGQAYVQFYILFLVVGGILLCVPAFARLRSKGVLATLFPTHLYTHKSTRTDLLLSVLQIAIEIPIGIVGAWVTSSAVLAGLQHLFPQYHGLTMGLWPTIFVQFAVMLVINDFVKYYLHYLNHKVPAFWAFHRVHHSAEVLTPLMGAGRTHPIEYIYYFIGIPWGNGLLMGAAFFLLGVKIDATAVAIYMGLQYFRLLYTPFYHSHIWVSFGKLDRFIMSPCMHIVHHGALPQHWDKNLGSYFTLWDWVFGTLYLPNGREVFPLGISLAEREARNPHNSIAGVLFEPFRWSYKALRGRKPTSDLTSLGTVDVILSDGSYGSVDAATGKVSAGAEARQHQPAAMPMAR